jgi:hypothetical protein
MMLVTAHTIKAPWQNPIARLIAVMIFRSRSLISPLCVSLPVGRELFGFGCWKLDNLSLGRRIDQGEFGLQCSDAGMDTNATASHSRASHRIAHALFPNESCGNHGPISYRPYGREGFRRVGLDSGFPWLGGRLVHLKGANPLLSSSLLRVHPRRRRN